jgi:hypothetical protein
MRTPITLGWNRIERRVFGPVEKPKASTMRRKLDPEEKRIIEEQALKEAHASWAGIDVEVIVQDYTDASGEPQIRIISKPKQKPSASEG